MIKHRLLGSLLVASLWSGSSLAETVSVDLISPATCVPGGGRLAHCTVATRLLEGTDFKTAVPLRTVFQRVVSGNCSTRYPLEVTLTPEGNSSTRYIYISEAQTVVRGANQRLLTRIELKDSSSWTPYASFADSCRISLNIQWNQVDVDSAAQASAILSRLQADLATKVAHRDALSNLVEYSSAFSFMRTLSNSLLTELNNEMMLFLREQAKESGDTVFKATLPCECDPTIQDCSGALNDTEKIGLANLYFALGVLGDNSNYLRPDGTPMTLEEYIGASPGGGTARDIIAKLSLRTTPEVLAQYQAQLLVASALVKEAQDHLLLARQQLSAWIPLP
ncbi:hypothetical protein [Archangium primigenium]|uniref:hypothetical protein n=1 Tax=[Archangium] primigenium TaxID=2792470 RepID=UPI0019571418|nr:hypothetical protein [Archangium primigenium]MBM7112137.1 hypothetical protein [Archangium primigenium]